MSRETPTPDFQLLVSTFATQAAVALGQIESPITKKRDVDLEQAKFAIDLLQVLSDKTKGNRDDDEEKYLEGCLYQLRLIYIDKKAKK
ncbi:MAG: DUF1844 domain-containing protein [Planctomycetota bacterium]